jgi:hypothetical protein
MTELRYGNLTKELQSQLEVKNIFTEYLAEFSFIEYPNYYESSQEIISIIKAQESAEKSGKWEAIKSFCDLWDADLIVALEKTLDMLDIPFDDEYIEYLTKVTEDLGAFVVQLKNHYQRPRPFQVAFYTEQNLHPYDSVSAQSPSYPSGHAMQSFLIFNIIAYHYEDKKEQLLKIAKQIADSRIIMGIHYPSDNAFGIQVVKELMLKDDIKEKYFPSVEENV